MAEVLPPPFGTDPLATHRVVVKDSTVELPEYPHTYRTGSEDLAREEIRLTALGTGYPARRGQGCAGFLVELGNGEVFIFDAGAGTNSAFNHLRVPYNRATRFFISHYHIDHIADLVVYYDFGQSNGRLEPMNVWGPAGEKPELGMEALIENIYKFAAWHDRTKYGNLDTRGFEMKAHEFVPESSQVAQTSGIPELDSAAVAGVAEMHFAPARRNGTPVATLFLQPVHFRHPARAGEQP